MAKLENYVELAQQIMREISADGENWRAFLTTASNVYKYGFYDQLMIYAQRPDATACASYEIWNQTMRRYVRRGAKGIALLDGKRNPPAMLVEVKALAMQKKPPMLQWKRPGSRTK